MRPRTLPLTLGSFSVAVACVPTISDLNRLALLLTLITLVFLQILSNLANDYGDGLSGVDSDNRKGPARALASGMLTSAQLKNAIKIFVILSAMSGLGLLIIATQSITELISFLTLGALAIVAAITYTVGKHPYGYIGLGDFSVFIFFGLLAVIGGSYLFYPQFSPKTLLAACAAGFLATAVLNINNMRDIDTDTAAGKRTVASLLGLRKAKAYQRVLVISALVCLHSYFYLHADHHVSVFSVTLPLFLLIDRNITKNPTSQTFNSALKHFVLTTFLTEVLFLFSLKLI